MEWLVVFLALSYGFLYSQEEVDSVCSFQNAEATSPQLPPGESASNRLISTLGSNALESYFNANDTNLSENEVRRYLLDVWPAWIFLVLLVLGGVLWTGYCFCVFCKCCYWAIRPATRELSKRKRRVPYGLMVAGGAFVVALVPVQVYYVT